MSDNFIKQFPIWLAICWSIAAVVYIGFITFATIPAANVRFADNILGFVTGSVVATIINFYFGSSAGSKAKTEELNTLKK